MNIFICTAFARIEAPEVGVLHGLFNGSTVNTVFLLAIIIDPSIDNNQYNSDFVIRKLTVVFDNADREYPEGLPELLISRSIDYDFVSLHVIMMKVSIRGLDQPFHID